MRLADPDIDVHLLPIPELQVRSKTPAKKLRMYESSIPGALSIVVGDRYDMAGLRIDVRQARLLRDDIDRFLDKQDAQ